MTEPPSSFLRFWWESLKQAFNVGWLVFGGASTAMPTLITLLQRHYPNAVSGPVAKWLVDNQVEIQLGIGGTFLLGYFIYSPYKHYKREMLEMQSAHQIALADKSAEVTKLETEVGNLRKTASAKTQSSLVRTVLGEFMIQLQRKREEIQQLEGYLYRSDTKKRFEEEANLLVTNILSYLSKNVGRAEAGFFRGAKPKPVTNSYDPNDAILGNRTRQRDMLINALEAYEEELKLILQRLD